MYSLDIGYKEPRIETVVLEKIRIGLRQRISPVVLQNLTIGKVNPLEFAERLGDEFAFAIETFLLGESLGEILVEYPEDWWEAFKERWFPKRLLKKYPVKYKTFRARQKVAYPHLNVPSIKDEPMIYMLHPY